MSPDQEARMQRGKELSTTAQIMENSDGSFSVPSQSVGEIVYRVAVVNGDFRCNCPDFMQRHEKVGPCKHVIGTKLWIATRSYLQNQPKPKVFADDAIQCDLCGSIRHISYGTYRGKKVFKCKDCGHKFREGYLKKTRYTADMITLTLDLYFSGLSLRKIARTVNDHFQMNLGAASIYRWIQKYVPLISEYVNSLTPQLSDTWQADELFVKMEGGINYKAHYGGSTKNIAFLWNVMDRKTRFLLASKLSTFRDVAGADRAFKEALQNAKGNLPQKLITDGLNSYKTVVASLPPPQRPQHIANAGVRKRHANNNRIERLNGTLRERVKVQRGWKNPTSKIAKGQRIHYNFVKPHQALEGQTPAERAGIKVNGRNKWLELLKLASANE